MYRAAQIMEAAFNAKGLEVYIYARAGAEAGIASGRA